MTQVPRFIEVLSSCRIAHEMGGKDYQNHRKVARKWPGALPNRKPTTRRKVLAVLRVASPLAWFTEAEERMLIAAYDQGLFERHEQWEAAMVAQKEAS